MTFAYAASRGLIAAGLLGALGGIASAQVMPPPVEPVTKHHLYSMGNPGVASREYTGGDNFLSTPWEMHRPLGSGFALGPVPSLAPPPVQGIVIQRVPAQRAAVIHRVPAQRAAVIQRVPVRRATVTRRTVRRARPAVE